MAPLVEYALYALGGSLSVFLFIAYTWVMYLAVMNLKRNKEALTPITKVFAYPMLAFGLVADMIFNFTIGSRMFLEIPQELLLTTRLKRHLEDHRKDWRDRNANWFCQHFLNPFDPSGNHC